MKVAAALLLIIASLMLSSSAVRAHVLLRDTEANVGAILHINPDDDPVAGQETLMYFDIQDSGSQVRLPANAYELFITGEGGERNVVATKPSGNVHAVRFVFPTRGLYKLEFVSKAAYDAFARVQMSTSVRVSRGVQTQAAAAQTSTWPGSVIAVCGASLLLLLITMYNNRKDILASSRL